MEISGGMFFGEVASGYWSGEGVGISGESPSSLSCGSAEVRLGIANTFITGQSIEYCNSSGILCCGNILYSEINYWGSNFMLAPMGPVNLFGETNYTLYIPATANGSAFDNPSNLYNAVEQALKAQ